MVRPADSAQTSPVTAISVTDYTGSPSFPLPPLSPNQRFNSSSPQYLDKPMLCYTSMIQGKGHRNDVSQCRNRNEPKSVVHSDSFHTCKCSCHSVESAQPAHHGKLKHARRNHVHSAEADA